MRRISINDASPGNILAKSVFTLDGRILLASGIELKKSIINSLITNNISELYIEGDKQSGIEVQDVVCRQTKIESKALVKKLINNYNSTNSFEVGEIKQAVEKIIDELLENRNILVNLSDIRSVDDYTFGHSVNVCILSLVTGIEHGFDRSMLRDLGVGAVLHDIGKLKIPESILKKPSRLTVEEFEEIMKHTVYGFEMLKNNKDVNEVSANIAFSHHERIDGSGYPLHLKGDNIHHCARIVAVADVFDALISDRVYRERFKPHEVLEYLFSIGNDLFDRKVLNCFEKFIAPYPVGCEVVLNTGEHGVVIRINSKMPRRPAIRIITNNRIGKLIHSYEVDLMKRPDIFVEDVCDV